HLVKTLETQAAQRSESRDEGEQYEKLCQRIPSEPVGRIKLPCDRPPALRASLLGQVMAGIPAAQTPRLRLEAGPSPQVTEHAEQHEQGCRQRGEYLHEMHHHPRNQHSDLQRDGARCCQCTRSSRRVPSPVTDPNTLRLPALYRALAPRARVRKLAEAAFAEDMGTLGRDVTSELFIPESARATAAIRARQGGTLAGLAAADDILDVFAPTSVLRP